MKIGFYLAGIGPTDGGIFQYSIYILKLLLKCDSVELIYVFLNKDNKEYFNSHFHNDKLNLVISNPPGKINRLLKQASDFWLTRYYLREKPKPAYLAMYRWLNPDRHFLNSYDIDLLHIPRQSAPAYQLKYPVVITMHDIQHIHFPEFFSPTQRIHKAISYQISIQESDHIIVSFNHVKKDLIKYFKTKQTKISVCPVPLNEDWLTEEGSSREELLLKYKIPEEFILTPSATWEHKNHIAVLEAMDKLRRENFMVFWVATGHKTPFYKTICKRIDELGLEDQVLFTGVVSERDLRGFYNMAKLVVIPTLYEAGSGPLFEAMRYEVPVICSAVTSLPDTIGNMDFVFDPSDTTDIAIHIKNGLTDTGYINRNKANSRKQMKCLKNLDYETSFIELYTTVLNTREKVKIDS